MPGQSQLHIDQALTNVSVNYQNADLVAERMFAPVPVGKQSNKYFIGSKYNLRADDDRRRPGTVANEIDWQYSTDTYYADGHALRAVIPDEWRENVDQPIDLDVDATQNLTEKIQLSKEVALAAYLVANATTVDMASKKWDDDSKDPIKEIDTQKETIAKATGKRPNVLMVSRPVFRGMRNNAKVVGRVTAAIGGQVDDRNLVTAAQLANLLEVNELIIADAVKLTSNEGATEVMDFVWGKYAALFYRPPAPGLRTIAWGYHFKWNVGVMGRLVKRYREENRESDIIESQEYYDQKLVVLGAGLLFSNVVT
jgi:hypothetical protein